MAPFKTLETIVLVLETMFLYTNFCSIPSSLPNLQGPALAFQIKPRCVTGVQTPQNTRLFNSEKKSLSLIFCNIYPTHESIPVVLACRLTATPLPLPLPRHPVLYNHVIRHSKEDAAGYFGKLSKV